MDAKLQATLSKWHSALLATVRDEAPDLTTRQMAMLLHIYLVDPPHTVRGLAKELGVTKPVISRALKTLGDLGYVRKKPDQADRRNVFIQRTVTGAVFLTDFADLVDAAAKP